MSEKKPEVKEIILGVTGSIAAYKSPEIVSRLKKSGYQVTVALTPSAQKFVAPLTLEVLSGNKVYADIFDEEPGVSHIELARRASLFLVAPATADFIARAANGIADDPVSLIYLCCACPVVIAPAMNEKMLNHPALKKNLETLISRGTIVVESEEGKLACGVTGRGRLASVEKILETVKQVLEKSESLKGKTVLITAGPTREKIDEVRFISNYSSGKMGLALAKEAFLRGARVELVCGPTTLDPPYGVHPTYVESAQEMEKACLKIFPETDITIMAAAVSDYRPEKVMKGKLKKEGREYLELKLVKNPDILSKLSRKKKRGQIIVGFAAETDNLLEGAQKKLKEKKLDLVVANLVGKGRGFEQDYNEVTFVFPDGRMEKLPLLSKTLIAQKLFDLLQNST